MARLASGKEVDMSALIANLVRKASSASYPRKSMAATLRQTGLLLTDDERQAILDAAIRSRDAIAGTPAGPDWLTVSDAARRLQLPIADVRVMLDTEQGRRELGWPWYLRGEWRIPGAAVRSSSRAVYMATLPESDPYSSRT